MQSLDIIGSSSSSNDDDDDDNDNDSFIVNKPLKMTSEA